jgi:hypothetical protein
MTEKQQVGLEISKFMATDKQYTYTVAFWAYQEGIIDSDEYAIVKRELDGYYAKDEVEESKKKEANRYMLKVLDVIGFTPTKILWRLIEQFPTRGVGDPANFELVPDNNKIIKDINIPSVDYFNLIEKIISNGFMEKGKYENKMTYKINFHKIMSLE